MSRMTVLRCAACGAAVEPSVANEAITRGYCGSSLRPASRTRPKPRAGQRDASTPEKDDLYDDAIKLACELGFASFPLLMRRLRIPLGRAVDIIEQMERAGHVGPTGGAARRAVTRLAYDYLIANKRPNI